jgi:hypothetical protein
MWRELQVSTVLGFGNQRLFLLEPEEDMACVEKTVNYLRAHRERSQMCELVDVRFDSPF